MDYKTVSDDFFVNLDLQTTLALPDSRETVLHFCESMQKQFPDMSSFFRRETGEFVLEGDRESGCYKWMELHPNQISAGYFNPPDLENAYQFHHWLLDRIVYFLGIGGIDVSALDVMYGFNFEYQGNRDELVSQALLAGSPLQAFVSEHEAKAVEFQPNLVIALTEDCYTQGRLALETRCSTYQVRTGNFDNEPISVYFTVRRYPSPGGVLNISESFANQCEIGEDMLARVVVPNICHPVATAIAIGR